MLTTLLMLAGCTVIKGLLVGNSKQTVADADALLKAGDLVAATAKYDEALAKAPADVDLAIGASYGHMLMGEGTKADGILAASEPAAQTRLGEIKLRRALLAMREGDLDKVKEYALASGMPAGKLLAAEADLADGDRDAAKALLEEVKDTPGDLGATATAYLQLMADPNALVGGLSEAQALWALGQRKIAVRSVEDLVRAYADTRDDGSEQLLLWAGRAAAVGETEISTNLLDAISVSPAGQAWRVQATRAINACASGDGATCTKILDTIKPIAPADGYLDARATAAMLLAPKDGATAKALLDGYSGDAVARALAESGDSAGAMNVAADPVFKKQLGG
ncbi:MAG: hypothetical protein EXR69_03665 [Myxococcales bacterium]|nr:hypothetical protein [Myxococcales bacterium]